MIALGIETSCDDTGLALVNWSSGDGFKVISEVVSSQDSTHSLYGGVVPELASREHSRNIAILFAELRSKYPKEIENLDLIAVTHGPGLKGCLLIGVEFARGLALGLSCSVLPAHHIEGHLLAPMMDCPELTFPYLALVASGGHTELVLVSDVGVYKVLARTIDDAAGEAFDKSAHLLGFSYPGGAKLAALAETGVPGNLSLPTVMKGQPGFSFSGLKTAIALAVRKYQAEIETNTDLRASLAFEIQEAIVSSLRYKVEHAMKETGLTNIALTGGVAANLRLQKVLSELPGCNLFVPDKVHCTDNATMVVYSALLRMERGRSKVTPKIRPRWPIEELFI